MSITEFDV